MYHTLKISGIDRSPRLLIGEYHANDGTHGMCNKAESYHLLHLCMLFLAQKPVSIFSLEFFENTTLIDASFTSAKPEITWTQEEKQRVEDTVGRAGLPNRSHFGVEKSYAIVLPSGLSTATRFYPNRSTYGVAISTSAGYVYRPFRDWNVSLRNLEHVSKNSTHLALYTFSTLLACYSAVCRDTHYSLLGRFICKAFCACDFLVFASGVFLLTQTKNLLYYIPTCCEGNTLSNAHGLIPTRNPLSECHSSIPLKV